MDCAALKRRFPGHFEAGTKSTLDARLKKKIFEKPIKKGPLMKKKPKSNNSQALKVKSVVFVPKTQGVESSLEES